MGAQVFYNSPDEAVAVTPVTFADQTTGQAADPSFITAVLVDPSGTITNYTYAEGFGDNEITRSTTGNYQLSVSGLSLAGLYTFTWVGTGNNVQQVTPGTFRLVSLSDVGTGMQGYWYCGMEELKSRLGILPGDKNFNAWNYEMQAAIATVSNWINTYCGRHFYQLTEARTYMPLDVWELPIDDLVSDPAVVSSAVVKLDYDGDGIYEVTWAQNSNYMFKLGPSALTDNFNINAAGGPAKPYRQLQVLQSQPGETSPGGGFLPFIWAYTHQNRVQITGTWGWNTIPPNVTQAALLLATDMYKSKDAPWGFAGSPETGVVKVQANPWVVELLRPYINFTRKVGV